MRRLRKAWSIGAGAALRLVGTAAILTFLALGVTACTGTGTPQPPAGGSGGQVSGTADFSSPSPLPADAQMVVRVVDNSQPDTATATIGETTVTAGGKSALCGVKPQVKRVLEIAGFDQMLTLFPDRAAALTEMSK
jgi:uncharacterized lipoprotein YbaY